MLGEFVNPKYADAERTTFKKPTRLECMMQDYPKSLPPPKDGKHQVGFTCAAPWLCFSPVKNNVVEAAKAATPACAASGEADIYFAHAEMLRSLGCTVEQAPPQSVAGVRVSLSPQIVLAPSAATCTRAGLAAVFPSPENVFVTARSTLVVRGTGNLVVHSLKLDGHLEIETGGPGDSVVVGNSSPLELEKADCVVQNNGVQAVGLDKTDTDEVRQMRGFVFERQASALVAPWSCGGFFEF